MPARRRKTRRTGPASCQHCLARIVFVTMTETGKSVPVDPIPVDDGNVCARSAPGGRLVGYVISAEHPAQAGYTRFAAHFATCGGRERPAPKPKPEPAPTLFDDEQGGPPCYTLNPDGTTNAARQCIDPGCTYPNPHTHPDLVENPTKQGEPGR